jgi:hypothetical protein
LRTVWKQSGREENKGWKKGGGEVGGKEVGRKRGVNFARLLTLIN